MEEKLFEFGARNQITLWGPWGQIMNYAIKQWSGLVKDFLYPRWDEFVYALNYSLVNNSTFLQPLEQALIFIFFEEPFVYDRTVYPTEARGDTLTIAKTIESRSWYVNSEHIPHMKTIPARQGKIPKKYKKVKRCDQYYGRSDVGVRRMGSKIRDLSKLKDYFSSD